MVINPAPSMEELHRLYWEVEEYMRVNLRLHIKENWQIFPTFSRGLDFVGYRFFRTFTLLRKSTCLQFKRKMNSIWKKIQKGLEMNFSEWCAINSYKGWLMYCDSFRLCRKYLEPLQPWAELYYETNIKGKAR